MHKKTLLSLAFVTFFVTACGVQTELKKESASRIAMPAFMVERTIPTGAFGLNAWERMHQRGAPATIYIEGDGHVTEAGDDLPENPTPMNPVALHLASRDLSKNLAYLARPCQFMKMPIEKGCDPQHWGNGRFNPVVIEAYQTAINDIVARYDIDGIHFVGYNGGANIAGILAATRPDTLSFRSVAGNLNPDVNQDMALDMSSINIVDYGPELAKIPQHHFIGAADEVITPAYYHSYRQQLGYSECIHYSLIPDADHERGWVEKWPELVKITPQCAEVHELEPLPPTDIGDHYKGYDKGLTKPRYNK